ncbi:hypothetical protein [Nakamurella endophytica]|uniref:DUF5666 domain-containing protein n=1 Tax=Nakamurella endophytica TaxID=1748367 RepID=A0A917SS94_9ACTN|nr:hypothetical protein [Nakamurella endophytica]GGL94333.1 hypothetical protein GCM10011594_12670 [Nakamurella endophytica]
MTTHPSPIPATPDDGTALPARRRPPRPAAVRRVVVGLAVAGGLALTGAGVAVAADTGGGSGTSAQPSPTAAGAGAPAPGSPTTPPPHVPHLDGTVTAVSDGTVTITDHDGFRRTIRTDSGTTYGSGLSAPVPVGTAVHDTGTVDTDGTSLDATRIEVPPAPPAGPPAHGPGGPRPPAPAPPAGTAPASPPAPPTGSSVEPSVTPSAEPSGTPAPSATSGLSTEKDPFTEDPTTSGTVAPTS